MKIRFTFSMRGATRYDDQAGIFVGFCPALKVYSQGKTEEEAKDALEGTLRLYVETCYAHGVLHGVLKRAGFTAIAPQVSLPTREASQEFVLIEKANFDRVFDMDVPLELVAATAARENHAGSSSCAS